MAGGAGGGDYAELGIAIQDSIAADARMEGKDGLNAQHRWSLDTLNTRMIGMAIIPAAVATPFVWMYAPDVWKGIWTAGLLFTAFAIVVIRQGNRQSIEKIRSQQLAEHRAKVAAQKPEAISLEGNAD